MSSQPPGISSLCRKYILPLFLVINVVLVNSGGFAAAKSILPGYAHGQSVPVSCLNRDIETGEHITDPAGKLQYIPFPTCNETSAPLSFRYGISETITCTIHSLSDTLYHLLEYYVHSDVPLTCRIPTFPLLTSSASSSSSSSSHENDRDGDSSGEETHDGSTTNDISSSASQPPFTPLTIALQGTLQLSHLHIWTDMNVLMHQSARLSTNPESYSKKWKKSKKDKKKGKKRDHNMKNNNKEMNKLTLPQGQIVAASAYSVPMVISATADDNFNDNDGDPGNNEAAALKKRKKEREMLMRPWAAEGGAKVIRGEPLVFTFRVGWVSSGDVLGLVQSDKAKWKSKKVFGYGPRVGLFFRLLTICFWVGVGMGLAVVVERVRHRRRVVGVYKGDGILGHRPFFSGFGASIGGTGVMSFGGDKGRINGYGLGLNGNGNGGGYGGYGGYSVGKKD